MRAGIGASSTSNPVGLIRFTRTFPAAGSGSIDAADDRYGSLSFVAIAAPTTPPTPSDVSKPARTRSYSRPSSTATSAATVDVWSEPARAGSLTSTPLCAPIARPLRIVSTAFGGAIDTSVTSPSCSVTSLSAASSVYSSLPLMTAGDAARSSRPSDPSRSAAAAGSGTGLVRTTIRINSRGSHAPSGPPQRSGRAPTRGSAAHARPRRRAAPRSGAARASGRP